MIVEQIRDAMDEILKVTDELEDPLQRRLLLIAHAQLVAAYDTVYEVNIMRLAELVNQDGKRD